MPHETQDFRLGEEKEVEEQKKWSAQRREKNRKALMERELGI